MSTTTTPFRMTPQRQAVLDAVRSSEGHPTVDQIHQDVQDKVPGLGMATVYRTLDLLVEHGLVLQLRIGEHPVARYDGNLDRHDHVRCDRCGSIWDVDLRLPTSVLTRAREATKVDVVDYDLQLTGICQSCRAA